MNEVENEKKPRGLPRFGLPSIPDAPVDVTTWRGALSAEARRTLASGRWPTAFLAIGWVHLAFFLALQAIDDNQPHSDLRHPALWLVEFFCVVSVLIWAGGWRWYNASPAVSVLARMWGTFLILSFNLSAMNAQTGWEMNWYKPVWANLSAFFLATLGLVVLTISGVLRGALGIALTIVATLAGVGGALIDQQRRSSQPAAALSHGPYALFPVRLMLALSYLLVIGVTGAARALPDWPSPMAAVLLATAALVGLKGDMTGIVYAVLSGAVASGLGYSIWYAALPGLSPAQGASVQLSVPVITAIAGTLMIGEAITPRLALCSTAILGGIALVIGSKPRV